MYDLIGCSDNYSKNSKSLWQYYNDNASVRFKGKITSQTENDKAKDVKLMLLLKYLSNSGRTQSNQNCWQLNIKIYQNW